jgi:hypothetical protein
MSLKTKLNHCSPKETCQINPPNSLQLEIEQRKQNATKAVAFSIWTGKTGPEVLLLGRIYR